MSSIKMITPVALTICMAMAFVSASSAMAENTTLCSADGSSCGVTHVHETSVTNAKLLTTIGTIECEALFLGDVKSTGSPLVISNAFTYSSCTLGGISCTFTEENGPGEIKVLKEGHETTKVTGEYLVHLVCGKAIDCSYNGVGLIGTGKGPLLSEQSPDNGEVTLSEQTTTKEAGGFLCPKTSKLDITTTPLSATYYSVPESTTLCSADGSGCGVTHVHETSVGNAKLLTSIGTAECEALFLGDVKGEALASPLVLKGSFTYSSCTLGGAECIAKEENGPVEIKVSKKGHETAEVTGEGLVHLVCGKAIDCSYTGKELEGTAKGPLLSVKTNPNGEVTISKESTVKETGGFLCPKTADLDITTTPLTTTYISG